MTIKEKSFIEIMARVGLISKGIVYCILGTMTLLAALNIGGKEVDKDDVFKTIFEQPFGKILLVILVCGLVSYITWRFIQAFKDTEDKGDDKKGIANRIGYAFSGLLYCVITYSAIKLILHSKSEEGNQEQDVAELMSKPYGKWLVIILGLFVIGRGIYQLYIAYSGKLEKKLNSGAINGKARNWAINAGKFGYTSRALVLGIIGFFFIMAALKTDPEQATDTKGTFNMIENYSYGKLLLCIVAGGLAVYGIFMFVEARYRRIKT